MVADPDPVAPAGPGAGPTLDTDPAAGPAEPDGSRAEGARAGREAQADADARALASTLRLRILRLCLDEALTNREIADSLGKNPATVLHHVRTLVDRGFLAAEPVRRGPRGSREVPYRATGKSWRMPDYPGKQNMMVETFLEELAEARPESVDLVRLGVRLSEDEHAELTRRVREFFGELAERAPTEGGTPYSLFFALHEDAARMRGRRPGADG